MLQRGIHREFTVIERCRIVESKSFALCRPWLHSQRRCSSQRILRWYEYSESMWQHVRTLPGRFHRRSNTVWDQSSFPWKSQKYDSKIFQANKASEKEPESMTEYCTIPYPFSCGGARSQPLLGWCCSLAAYGLRIFANLALRSWPVSIQNYRKDQGPIRVNKKMKMHFSSIMKWTRVKLTAFKNQDRLKTTNVLCEWYQQLEARLNKLQSDDPIAWQERSWNSIQI